MKISDKERDEISKIIQMAYAEGRLTEHELEDRLNQITQISNEEELSLLVKDLPAIMDNKQYPSKDSLICCFSGLERKGNLYIPENYAIKAYFSGLELDFSKAIFNKKITHMNILAICAGIEIKFAPNAHVEVSGLPILAGISHQGLIDIRALSGPIIKIRATAIFSGIEIKSKTF